MKVTVFTPAYNRGYIIWKLFNSLQQQTVKDFEWLVVDDGSTDDTSSLFDNWKDEKEFCVRYIRQENGGKHRAINRALKEARGELFFIVDSDDYLADNAIETIIRFYNSIQNREEYAGVCGLRCFPDGKRIGGENNFGVLDTNSLDFRFKYKISGDMAEVIKTEVMRQFPFPEFDGEKFCPEAVLFNRISQKYILRYFYEKIYICDYLPDGLTAKITKIRMKSPLASMTCYSELVHYNIPVIQKMKAAINFWRFSFCSKMSFLKRIHAIPFWGMLVLPIGYIYHRLDIIKN